VVLPISIIRILGKSVKGLLSYDRTYTERLKLYTYINIYRYRYRRIHSSLEKEDEC